MQETRKGTTEASDQLIRRAASGGGIALVGNVVDKGLRFPLEMLLARVLGAADYGSYSLGYGLAIIAGELSMLGLPSGVVRFGALYRGVGDLRRVKGTLSSALVIATLCSLTAAGGLFVLAAPISGVFDMPGLARVLRVFALAFPFYAITLMAAYAAGAFQAIRSQTVVANICRPLANLAVVAIAFLLGFRLLGAVYGFLISWVISAGFGLYLLTRIFPDLVSGLEPAYEVGKLLRFSLPVLLVGCSHLLLGQTDRIMLGYFRASKDLGIYSAAAVISQQAGLITYSFGYIFCPIISDLYHRREFGDLQRLYKTVTRWIVSVNVVLLVLLILFSRQIMAIFGSEFTAGGLVLVVLAAAHLIGYVSGGALVGYVLRMSGKQDIELINAIVLLVLNIVLNLWLIPLYGILGAAVATGISFTVISALRIAEVCLLLQMHPYDRNYHKSFVAAAVVVLLAVFLSRWTMTAPYWIFVMAALALLYFVVLFFLGLEYEDRMIWETIKSRISRPSLSTGTSR